MENYVSEDDGVLISVRGWVYFEAIVWETKNHRYLWYKMNKKTRKTIKIDPKEIVEIIQKSPERILFQCPCVQIENNSLIPIVTLDGESA